MFKYDPDQFEIVTKGAGKFLAGHPFGKTFIDKHREQGGTGHLSENMLGLALIDSNGIARSPYGRILIRRK